MSTNLLAKAWKVNFKNLPCGGSSPAGLKLIFLKLCDQADDSGMCRISYRALSEATTSARKTVIDHIRELENLGLISRLVRFEEKTQLANEYQINLDRLEDLTSLN